MICAESRKIIASTGVDKAAINRIIKNSEKAIIRNFYDITSRELEILQLLSMGLHNKDIAVKLELGEGTVRNYVSSLLKKLDARNRTDVIRKAKKVGLL
ncbi:MAG: response regulator transcription factor [Candidatus Helarchaeota archaeon]